MITVNDHQTIRLFDPREYLGPKRRKLLDTSWSGVFRKYLLEKLPVEKIAKHFNEGMGRPSKELYTAIGTLILQQLHDLSDPEVTRAVAFNIDWHYALDITNESDSSKYISERTLRTYRKILIKEGLDRVLFETLTDSLIKAFGVDTTKQRLDSTLIQSNMRKLGRIRIFANTIRKFLKKLRRTHPDLFDTILESEFCGRYLAKESEGCFSRVKPTEAGKTLEGSAEDLLYLVELFGTYDTVSTLSEYKLLERVLSEQRRVTGSGTDAKVEIKLPGEVSPAIDTTRERKRCPEELTCDTLYGGDDNVQEALTKGVEIVAPLKGPAPASEISLSDFEFNEKTDFVTRCPEGHEPENVCRTRTNRIRARFNRKTCCVCPHLKNCPVKLEKKTAFLRYDNKTLRLSQRRTYEQTKEFKDRYRWRAGIEGTNSHLKSDIGAGQLRVRGMDSVRFTVILKVLGLNIQRCARALLAHFYPFFTRIGSTCGTLMTWINRLYVIFHILLSKIRFIYEF